MNTMIRPAAPPVSGLATYSAPGSWLRGAAAGDDPRGLARAGPAESGRPLVRADPPGRQPRGLGDQLAARPGDRIPRPRRFGRAFAVVWGTLMERRVVGATITGQVLAKPVGAGGARAFGPRYIHDVGNANASSVAVSVHAFSPPLPAMTRYDLTPAGLVVREHRGSGGMVAVRPAGARTIDEILASARARLTRLMPREAFA